MLLYFKTLAGLSFQFEASPSETMGNVKALVAEKTNFPLGSFWLVYNCIKVRDEMTVSQCGITESSLVHVVMRANRVERITVRTVHGAEYTMFVEPETKVGQFKQTVAAKVRIPAEQQRLVSNGQEFPNETNVQSAAREGHSVIYIVQKPKGEPAHQVAAGGGVRRHETEVGDGLGIDMSRLDVTATLPRLPDPSETDAGLEYDKAEWITISDPAKRRQVRNRLAAERSRQRKQKYVNNLEMRLSLALSRNEVLESKVQDLQETLAAMQLSMSADNTIVPTPTADVANNTLPSFESLNSWYSSQAQQQALFAHSQDTLVQSTSQPTENQSSSANVVVPVPPATEIVPTPSMRDIKLEG